MSQKSFKCTNTIRLICENCNITHGIHVSEPVLTPEDIPKFDIKPEEEEEPTDKVIGKRRYVMLALSLVVFLIGFMVAPAAISEGTYSIELGYMDDVASFSVQIDDSIKTPIELTSFIHQFEEGNATISYYSKYSGEPGSKITFTIEFTEGQELEIAKFEGKLFDSELSHTFAAKTWDGTKAEFEFTILRDTSISMGLLFAISFLWLSEAIPLAASSLIVPVVLVMLDISSATASLAYFAEPIIFLFLAGFLMAEAMHRARLDQYISYRIFAYIPPNGKLLMFSLMCLSALFSMVMSNTAACAILIPLSLQLLKGVELENPSYRKTVVLGIAYASTIGGIGSLIGTPPNIIAAQLLNQFDPTIEISFAEWFLFGLPMVIIMIPITFFYLWSRFKPVVDKEKLRAAQLHSRIQIHEAHTLTKDQFTVGIIFIVVFSLWMTTSFHGISSSIIAVFGAVILFMTGQIEEKDVNKINWNALLTFGGGLTLGSVIIGSGLADFIGGKAVYIAGLPTIVILFAVALVGLILTAFASNTASAVILVPIVMPLGYILGISPLILAVVVAIAASVDFAIVIGTPPTMIAYSTGLFQTKDIFNIGIVIDIVGLLTITLISYALFGTFAGFV